MEYFDLNYPDLDIEVSGAVFTTPSHRREIHLMLRPGAFFIHFEEQLDHLYGALDRLFSTVTFRRMHVVFKRYFLSDTANQYPFLKEKEESEDCAVSVVQQPPLNGSKMALWAYFIQDVQPVRSENGDCLAHTGQYRHIWSAGLFSRKDGARSQTEEVFADYDRRLGNKACTIADNCIRTWLFVNQVDVNYGDVVTARKCFFDKHGLTKDTHYLASTGIEGRHYLPDVDLLVDAYSVAGLQPGQVSYLQAPEYLNQASDYGVTFERGTAVNYGDRRHLYISGTASIDCRGAIVHPNDINGQLLRTLDNIRVLLHDGGATMNDLAQMIVYLRDIADAGFVARYFSRHYAWVPMVIVQAPVCRPGWLIEIECIAITSLVAPEFENY